MDREIVVKGLSFGYGKEDTLRDISFSIEKGEFISIIGPNGSGKSTLLKNIAALLKPTKGSIDIEGKNVRDYKVKDLARKLALVPQDTTLDYDFSVYEVVLMGRSPHLKRFEKEGDRDYKRVKASLILTDTLSLSDRSINEISGGERQRVIIARALAQEPQIILLDEPTSHLDMNHQMEVLSLLQKLNKEKNVTIIVVLHDINLAARYSDQVILLKDGQLLEMGTPEDVINYENMGEIYDMNMVISKNVYTGKPHIIPLSSRLKRQKHGPKRKVHVICGGGTGAELINKLDSMGHEVSVGVINRGDTDWEVGRRLSVDLIEEMPFTDIGEEAYSLNIARIKACDVIVLTSVPYGRGNIKNLEAAYVGLEKGKVVYLYDRYDQYENFDFVNGKAYQLIETMKKRGLKVFKTPEELLQGLGTIQSL